MDPKDSPTLVQSQSRLLIHAMPLHHRALENTLTYVSLQVGSQLNCGWYFSRTTESLTTVISYRPRISCTQEVPSPEASHFQQNTLTMEIIRCPRPNVGSPTDQMLRQIVDGVQNFTSQNTLLIRKKSECSIY